MANDLYTLAYELKNAIDNDSRIKILDVVEMKMKNDKEVITLANQKDMACSHYSDALNHFPENSPEVKKAQRDLYEKKLALDNHPIVREYLEAYKNVRELYHRIDEILFSHLNLHQKGDK